MQLRALQSGVLSSVIGNACRSLSTPFSHQSAANLYSGFDVHNHFLTHSRMIGTTRPNDVIVKSDGSCIVSGPLQTLPPAPFVERAVKFKSNTCVISPTADGVERSYTYDDLLRDATDMVMKIHTCFPNIPVPLDLNEKHVAYLFHPSYEYVVTKFAVGCAGGVCVPLHPGHPEAELDYIIENSESSLIIAHKSLASKVENIAKQRNIKLLVIDDIPVGAAAAFAASYSASQTATTNPSNFPSSPSANPLIVDLGMAVDKGRRALMIYTSGTTGKPKGVVTTHANILSQVRGLVQAWKWASNDHIINVLPLHHVHGVVNVVACALWAGAKVTFLPPPSSFDARKLWRYFQTYEDLTVFMAVPTIYSKLIQEYDSASRERQAAMTASCKKFRLMVSGSMALPMPTLEKWQQVSGHTLLERYGMTEVGMALSNPYDGVRKPGFVGKPLPGMQLKVQPADAQSNNTSSASTGAAQVAGAAVHAVTREQPIVGELLIKGDNVFQQYWKRPDATKESFDEKGWFITGDIGSVDKHGDFKILGRSSVDILKSAGYKISALDVEREILEHPDVAEVAVIGLPSIEYEQIVAAVITLKPNAPPMTVKSLKDSIIGRLAAYKIPRALWITDIPRNAMGKVNKKELIKLFPQDLIPKSK
jgi:malonyl-CoA/methylmalonyl-CoA synthetase